MEEKEFDFHDQIKEKFQNGSKSKYKTLVFGLVSGQCDCTTVIDTLLPYVECEIELGKSLKTFFINKEIAEAFRGREDIMHLAKKTLIGAGCKEENIENILKKAGYTKREIHSVINEITLKNEEIGA